MNSYQLDEGEWKVEWKTDDFYTIILKIYYTFYTVLLNWKYVHNIFTILLPNFQSLFKVRRKIYAPGMARPFMFAALC
jgi:hypothetical protein